MLPLWPDYPMRSVLIDHNKVWPELFTNYTPSNC